MGNDWQAKPILMRPSSHTCVFDALLVYKRQRRKGANAAGIRTWTMQLAKGDDIFADCFLDCSGINSYSSNSSHSPEGLQTFCNNIFYVLTVGILNLPFPSTSEGFGALL
ncbi:hypothetical protein MLD38_008260 [Melastoma candidum]|uniref:Uncharacterized protein n=1 Tax=Melastoma candidum TaxID=119954 RepID=A0ACB9RXG6_9MYRT|nr:hypothetical protein MLD38_008260 [Melastoma candidum]